jgi:hypothetical protein
MRLKADCYDNAPMERLFHNLNTDLVRHRKYQTRAEASATSSPSSRASTIEHGSIPRSDISPDRNGAQSRLNPSTFSGKDQDPLLLRNRLRFMLWSSP